ncbi:hypothetical protein K1719_041329 [Acacia pycnantha]|nr:hypothetical protein K1719_041329 [Acacia pycnantha]
MKSTPQSPLILNISSRQTLQTMERLDGKSLVLDIPEDGFFAKYEAEEPEDSTLPTTTRCEANLDNRTNLISIDTNLNSGAQQPRKQKQPIQRIVDPKVKRRRGSKPEQCLPLSTVVRSNVDFQVKEEDDDHHLPVLKRPLTKQPEPVVRITNLMNLSYNITEEALENMEYLTSALTETLRLYPAVPWDSKICFSSDTLPDGFSLKKGDLVSYLPYAMGIMKCLWGDDADEFKLERWLDKNGKFQQESSFKFTAF